MQERKYISEIASPRERAIYKLIKTTRFMDLTTMSHRLGVEERVLKISISRCPIFQFNKKENTVQVIHPEIKELPEIVDSKTLLVNRLVESSGEYTFEQYTSEVGNYKKIQYGFELGELKPYDRKTFKSTKHELIKRWFFEIY